MIYEERFYSSTLEVETYFLIAIPDDIDLPVPGLMLFRSVPEEWLNKSQDSTRGGRNIISVLNDLMQKSYCPPMAFILPRTSNESETANVPYGKALYPELIKDKTYIGNGDMDGFIFNELIPRTFVSGIVKDGLISVDGFSVGGASAIYYAMKRPDLFASFASYDASLLKYEFDNPQIYPGTPSDLKFSDFPYLYGYPPDEDYFRSINPMDLISDIPMPPGMIHYSNSQSPAANGWRVKNFLNKSKIRNYASQSLLNHYSDHTWWWADEHLYRSLPFHARFLQKKEEMLTKLY